MPLPAFLWMWKHQLDFCVVGGNGDFMVPMPWGTEVLGGCILGKAGDALSTLVVPLVSVAQGPSTEQPGLLFPVWFGNLLLWDSGGWSPCGRRALQQVCQLSIRALA